MNIVDITRDWLKEHGYDGLCIDEAGVDPCGCSLDDFMPCLRAATSDNVEYGGPEWDICQPAYARVVNGVRLYYPTKEEKAPTLSPDPQKTR